jgi:hypothetical protein
MQCGGTVVIAGATKCLNGNPQVVNGVYDLAAAELHNGRALFRKRGDDSVCLRFTKGRHWMVSAVSDKDANNELGYAMSISLGYKKKKKSQDQHLPPVSGWGVWDGKEHAADVGITVTHSDAFKSMVRYVMSAFFASVPRRCMLKQCVQCNVDFYTGVYALVASFPCVMSLPPASLTL